MRTAAFDRQQTPSLPVSPSVVGATPRARVSAPDAIPRLEVPSTPFSEPGSTVPTSGGGTPGSTPSAPPSGRRSGRRSAADVMRVSAGMRQHFSMTRRTSTRSLPHVPSEPRLTDDQLLLRDVLRGWREAATAQHLTRLAEFERLEREGGVLQDGGHFFMLLSPLGEGRPVC